jgi:hypothetical protein
MVSPLQAFSADVLFLNPNRLPAGVASLKAAGCDWEAYPGVIDPFGPTVFGRVTGMTDLPLDRIHTWLTGLIGQFRGDVYEWGFLPEGVAPAPGWLPYSVNL